MSFDEWIRYVFDREISEKGWWYQLPEDEEPFAPPPIEYLQRLCSDAGEWSKPFSDEQIGQGLWFVFHNINHNLQALGDDAIPTAAKVASVLALPQLHLDLFARRCAATLEDADRDHAEWSLNTACYMLWDITELHDPWEGTLERSVDEACLSALRSILRIPNEVCQQSALHGLNHWHERYLRRVSELVEEFLASPAVSGKLIAYARQAREGAAP